MITPKALFASFEWKGRKGLGGEGRKEGKPFSYSGVKETNKEMR